MLRFFYLFGFITFLTALPVVPPSACFAHSPAEASEASPQAQIDLNAYQFSPKLEVIEIRSEIPDAYMRGPRTLVISSSLLRLARRHHALDFVVAHESMHVLLGHGKAHFLGSLEPEMDELEADSFALELLRDEERNSAGGEELLEAVVKHLNGMGIKRLYPTIQRRLFAMKR